MVITRRPHNAQRARITSQGQITVPKGVRDQLGLSAGDEVEFEPSGDTFLLKPRKRRSVLEFAGIAAAGTDRLPATAQQLDLSIRDGMTAAVTAHHARIAKQPRSSR
jgi:AbrB family looped-hinge helix DNA binding protein